MSATKTATDAKLRNDREIAQRAGMTEVVAEINAELATRTEQSTALLAITTAKVS
jgi:hypothetical protein